MKDLDVKQLLQKAQVEGILVTDPYNMRYLSGFSGGEGALFLAENARIIITDSRYTEAAGKESDFIVLEESRKNPRGEILSQLVREHRISCLGFEDGAVTYQQ